MNLPEVSLKLISVETPWHPLKTFKLNWLQDIRHKQKITRPNSGRVISLLGFKPQLRFPKPASRAENLLLFGHVPQPGIRRVYLS